MVGEHTLFSAQCCFKAVGLSNKLYNRKLNVNNFITLLFILEISRRFLAFLVLSLDDFKLQVNEFVILTGKFLLVNSMTFITY